MFLFDNIEKIDLKSSFYTIIDDSISSKKMLFEKFSESLRFPSYFGYNWDALFECLRDLDWLTEINIIIIHKGIPKLDNSDILIYLSILRDTVIDWKDDNQHNFFVYFPKDKKEYIEKLLNQALTDGY